MTLNSETEHFPSIFPLILLNFCANMMYWYNQRNYYTDYYKKVTKERPKGGGDVVLIALTWSFKDKDNIYKRIIYFMNNLVSSNNLRKYTSI